MAVNIQQCVVRGDAQSCLANAGGRLLVFWFMREWGRFGIETFVFEMGAEDSETKVKAAA